MELAGKQRLGCDARNERLAIIGRRGNNRTVVGNNVERVHEVDVVAARQPLEKWRLHFFLQSIPTHVRDFEVFTGMKTNYLAGKQVESLLRAEFFALGKKQLESETDAQKRFVPPHDVANR